MRILFSVGVLLMTVHVATGSARAEAAGVSVEYTGTCIGSEDNKAIAGATVRLYTQNSANRAVATTKSDQQGSFQLRHLINPDQASSSPSFIIVAAPDRAAQIVALNGATRMLVVQLSKAVVVSGRILDAEGTPVPDAVVHIGRHSITGVWDAISDENGHFQLDDLPEMVLVSERDRLLKHRLFASHPQLGMKSVVIEKIPCQADIQFDTNLPAEYGMQFRTAWMGTHVMPGGVTMTVTSVPYHGPNMSTTALFQWPAKDGLPAMQYEIHIASDSFGNLDHWTAMWPKDRCQLWIANSMNDVPYIRAIDFSDPTAIVSLYRARKRNEATERTGQDIYDARVRRLHGEDGKQDIPSEVWQLIRSRFPKVPRHDDNHQMYGYEGVSEALTEQQWKVQGTVKDQHGKPLPSIQVKAMRAGSQHRITSVGTKNDGTYELSFRLKLSEAATNPDIQVAPVLANYFERAHADAGCFRAACTKLAPTDSLLLGQVATADFELWPAASLEGRFSKADVPSIAGGQVLLTWSSPASRALSKSAPIDSRGSFRITDLPTGQSNPLTAEVFAANDRSLAHGEIVLSPGRMVLSADESWSLSATPIRLGPVAVSIVHNQKPMAPPDDEQAFANIVSDWLESCQASNTQAIKAHDPDVWTKVVGGHNVVRLQYRRSQKMMVHTDEGTVPRMISQIAFQMYEMRPGALFARSGEETLVLESPLIEPTIRIMSHRSLECFFSTWYQPYIDAWNHAPPSPAANTAKIGVDIDGVLTLDGKPVPKDIHQLTSVLNTAGYDRRDSIALITADPLTPYAKLHWVMWKLGQSGWKNKIILRIDQ